MTLQDMRGFTADPSGQTLALVQKTGNLQELRVFLTVSRAQDNPSRKLRVSGVACSHVVENLRPPFLPRPPPNCICIKGCHPMTGTGGTLSVSSAQERPHWLCPTSAPLPDAVLIIAFADDRARVHSPERQC